MPSSSSGAERLRIPALVSTLLIATLSPAAGAGGDLIELIPFPGSTAQGITVDGADGTYWTPSLFGEVIHHYAPNGSPLGAIPSPFGPGGRPTGIAWYPQNDTLLVVDGFSHRLMEIDRTGAPVGLDLFLPLVPVPNQGGPVLRGMAVHPGGGNGGLGSLYVVESVATRIYEFDLGSGVEIRSFLHPQDPDGFPGNGLGAPSGGIEVLVDGSGALLGFDLIGGNGTFPQVLRLDADGLATGYEITLDAIGASNSGIPGIVRTIVIDPDTGLPVEAIVGVSESLNAVFVVDGSLPPIAQIEALDCSTTADAHTLVWDPGPGYDAIEVRRDGSLIATLPGGATTLTETGLPDGVHRYSVQGRLGPFETEPASCLGVVGAGQILDQVEVVGDPSFTLDLTSGDGLIYLTTSDGTIQSYGLDLTWAGELPGPFTGPDDELTGIAYRPDTGTLLVVNRFDNMMQELDVAGTPIGPPVLLQIDVPDDEETYLGGITYDPAGNGGLGEIWAVESTRSIVYRLALDGSVLDSFLHPDEVADPTPDPSFIDTFSLGISGVPGAGSGFDRIELTGGSVFDRRMTRVVQVDPLTGEPDGPEVPLAAALQARNTRYYSIENTVHLGEPVTYALDIRAVLYRLRRSPPAVLPVSYLRCAQPELVDEVQITFLNQGPYDSITIHRDGSPVATLPGDATAWLDLDAAPGVHDYVVVPSTGGLDAAPARCSLRVGVGARLETTFISPAFSPYQVAKDPSDGSYVVSSNSGALAEILYRFDANLDFIGTIPAPGVYPWLVATMAIRPTAGGSELWSITWEVPAPFQSPQVFRLTRQALDGSILAGPFDISLPGSDPSVALTYPAGMVHDPESDSFLLLERNTDQYLRLALDGAITPAFPHPAPPYQQFVFNLGNALVPERDVLIATTAGPFDDRITKAIEMSRDGTPNGTEIPLTDTRMNPIYGITDEGSSVLAMGSLGSLPMMVRVKASDPVPPPLALDCTEGAPGVVVLTWSEPIPYDLVMVRRNGVPIATLPAGSTVFIEPSQPPGAVTYSVVGQTVDGTSAQTTCALVVAGGTTPFRRGDANQDGVLDLGDPITILETLFSGGDPLPCPDAADANDDGAVDIADPISLLEYLFGGGPPPPAPFPGQGADPSPDLLDC
ncbi:MAG: hypothetical protein ACO4B4_01790 [Planctomycetota bacterium]